MEVMIARKKKMSELSDGFVMYPQVLENIKVKDKELLYKYIKNST